MDLDLATDINHIRQVVEIFSTNSSVDIVYGSRLHKDSEVIGRSVKREITSRIFNWILKNIYLLVSVMECVDLNFKEINFYGSDTERSI